jgi:hypothetical protein
MKPIPIHARQLVYELLELMPTPYQQASLKTMLTLFLEARGSALPQHSKHKSPSALSRFLNLYSWSTRAFIRLLLKYALQALLERSSKLGRRPILRAIIDLTPLEKSGKFEGLEDLIHLLNKKRGLQLVVLYLEVNDKRIPWSFRPWRGKGSASPSALGLKLLRSLPKVLTSTYEVMVLADSAFCSVEFIKGIRQLGHHGVIGVRKDRRLQDDGASSKSLKQLSCSSYQGSKRVCLEGLDVAVYVASFWLKREGGSKEQRFVLCTKAMSAKHIVRWGKRRWKIEGFFKTVKGRFSLDRFAQGSKLGVYRYLIMSMAAYVLAHWGHLRRESGRQPDWGEAARAILEEVLAEVVVMELINEIEERRTLLLRHGIDIRVHRCKI